MESREPASPNRPTVVVVSNFDMPFGAVFLLVLKFALAAAIIAVPVGCLAALVSQSH